jgi:hypothetical protein
MITTTSNPPPLKTYIVVDWVIDQKLTTGSSVYSRVNLRKKGVKPIKCRRFKKMLKHSTTNQWLEIIDIRIAKFDPITNQNRFEWWQDFYEVIDKKKFFLARVQLGF